MQAADTHNDFHNAKTTGLETKGDTQLPGSTGRKLRDSDKDSRVLCTRQGVNSAVLKLITDMKLELSNIHGLRGWGLGTKLGLIMKGYCDTVW